MPLTGLRPVRAGRTCQASEPSGSGRPATLCPTHLMGGDEPTGAANTPGVWLEAEVNEQAHDPPVPIGGVHGIEAVAVARRDE